MSGLDAEHVRALEEALEALPPPTCVRRGKQIIPLDGHHTIAAHQNAGKDTIGVRIVDEAADTDLYAMAFEANASHGMALTLSDRRAFAEHLLLRDPESSNLEVSRRSGLAPTTIASLREQMETDARISPSDRTVTRGDQSYSYPATRRPGELPATTVGEALGELGAKVFSSKARVRQKQITNYLRRLAVSLADQGDLLADPAEAVGALDLVLGQEGAQELIGSLDEDAGRLLDVLAAHGAEE